MFGVGRDETKPKGQRWSTNRVAAASPLRRIFVFCDIASKLPSPWLHTRFNHLEGHKHARYILKVSRRSCDFKSNCLRLGAATVLVREIAGKRGHRYLHQLINICTIAIRVSLSQSPRYALINHKSTIAFLIMTSTRCTTAVSPQQPKYRDLLYTQTTATPHNPLYISNTYDEGLRSLVRLCVTLLLILCPQGLDSNRPNVSWRLAVLVALLRPV